MTPAEELQAAAAKVRETGAAATPGPWVVVKHNRRQHPGVLANAEIHKPGGSVRSVSWKVPGEIADAEWNALTHPGLAGPLVAILESAAGQAKAMSRADDFGICDEPGAVEEALNLARVINGGGS